MEGAGYFGLNKDPPKIDLHWSSLDLLHFLTLQFNINIANISVGDWLSWELLLHWLHGIWFENGFLVHVLHGLILINWSRNEEPISVRWQGQPGFHHFCFHHPQLELVIHWCSDLRVSLVLLILFVGIESFFRVQPHDDWLRLSLH